MVSKNIIITFCMLACWEVARAKDNNWDYIVFAQSWPVTTCIQWKASKQGNTCALPSDHSAWTVHGIWPLRVGSLEPTNCATSERFDQSQLKPLINDLKQHWTNVQANSGEQTLWKHEWDKHGTCAVSSPQLKGVKNYFSKGIDWNKKYKIQDMLSKATIKPGTNFTTAKKLGEAVKAVIGKDPIIHCVVDKSKKNLLSEVRICMDKSFKLVDCGIVKPKQPKVEGVLTTCGKKTVSYLDKA